MGWIRKAKFGCAAAALAALGACQAGDGGNAGAGNSSAADAGLNAGENSAANAALVPQGGVADPETWVMNQYVGEPKAGAEAPVAVDKKAHSQNTAYSPRLRALFAEDEKYAAGEVGRLEFDFTTGAQDDDISDVKVSRRDTDGATRRIVTAEFVNLGKPAKVHYYFEKMGGSWFLDDVASPGYGGKDGLPPWTLSLVLGYG